ncbi:MAG: hypothetical protein QOJ76_869, partial [Acidobacteriota bacterium]|nr:hypothetical protein [Acidobacteriota bacterium]
MRQVREWVVTLATAAALLATGACADNSTQNSSPGRASGVAGGYTHKTKKAGEPVYIGFSMDTLKEERWQR